MAIKIMKKVIFLLSILLKNFLVIKSKKPLEIKTDIPIAIIKNILRGAKLIKFLAALLIIYLTPSKFNKFSTSTVF